MIKIGIKKIDEVPLSELHIYNSFNPVPFSLKIGKYSALPETVYCRNLSDENFIEFRFDKNTNQLYEITLVAVQLDSVIFVKETSCDIIEEGFYNGLIAENSHLEISLPIIIHRSDDHIKLIWCEKSVNNFRVSDNCTIGIDDNGCLCSVTLISLTPDVIYEIFGF